MYKNLMTEFMAARKAGDHKRVDTLKFIIADIDKHVFAERKACTGEYLVQDADVIAVLRNLVSSTTKSIVKASKASNIVKQNLEDPRITLMEAEREAIAEFLPPKVSGDDLRAIIQGLGVAKFKEVMPALKAQALLGNFDYDSREAVGIAKEIFV